MSPSLFYVTYLASIAAMAETIILGLIKFAWWLPIVMIFLVAPLVSILISRWFPFPAFVFETLAFLLVGFAAVFYSSFAV
jgi:hypothetical protein